MSGTVFAHAETFYKALDDRAEDEVWEDGMKVRVFHGKVSTVFRGLGISQSFYGRVKDGLVNSGCMAYSKRGSRGFDSTVVLLHPPVEDEFARHEDHPLTKNLAGAILAQRLEELERSLGGMNVVDALVNVEQRLREHDLRIQQVEQEFAASKQDPPKPQRRI